MKKIIRRVAVAVTCAAMLCATAFAAQSRYPDATERLVFNGFIVGDDGDMMLDTELTRAQASVLLARAAGTDENALENGGTPFTDLPEWADKYVSWLYEQGAVNGVSETQFMPDDPVSAGQFYAMLLRMLGWNEQQGDFEYKNALEFAKNIGLLDEEEAAYINRNGFDRDSAGYALYNAMRHETKSGEVYCVSKAQNIDSSYSMAEAEVITGESEIYDILSSAVAAMDELDGFTLTVQGKYIYEFEDETVTEGANACVTSDRANKQGLYEAEFTSDTVEANNGCAELYYDDGLLYASLNNGEWEASEITGQDDEYLLRIYSLLFGPNVEFLDNYDVARKDGEIILSGFSNRYELLGDPTNVGNTQYYFDVELYIDEKTGLLTSALVTYDDVWSYVDGDVGLDFQVEYSFDTSGAEVEQPQIPALGA